MASYLPIVLDQTALQLGQLPAGQDLDMTSSNIVNLPGIAFANANLTGNVTYQAAGNFNLGTIANVKLQGGANGQVVQTDGAGNLSFAPFTPNVILNDQSNVLIPTANSNINFSVNAVPNVGVFTSNALYVTGNVYANAFVATLANGNSNIAIQSNGAVSITANGYANMVIINSNGSHGLTSITDDVTITGNLTVLGSSTTVTTATLNVQSPIIEEGGGPNGSILTSQDGKDRGILMHTFGVGQAKLTTSVTNVGNTTIALNNTTGLVAGQRVTYAANPAALSTSAVITTVNAANIVITPAVIQAIPTAASLAIGTNLDRFMGWNTSNGEFNFGSNVTDTSDVITYSALANVRASYFIGSNGIASLDDITAAGNINAVANINAANFVGTLANGNSKIAMTAGGNIGLFSNNISVANIVAVNPTSLTGTGINVAGYLNATGNIVTGANFVGILANGTSNIRLATNGNIGFSANGNSNVVVFTSSGDGVITTTGANIFGYLYSQGNITTPANFVGAYANGNTNINIPSANGNIAFTVTGNANVLLLQGGATSEAIFKGNANVTSNLHVLSNSFIKVAGNTGTSTWYAAIKASNDSANFVGNYTISLPPTAGANNQWLMVDGGGNLRFSSKFVRYAETVVAGGTVSGGLSPDLNSGTIFQYTLNGATTISGLTNAVAGSSFILQLTQDSTGSRIVTWGSSFKFSGGSKTLSIGPGTTDVVAGYYDGTNYYVSLTRGFV